MNISRQKWNFKMDVFVANEPDNLGSFLGH